MAQQSRFERTVRYLQSAPAPLRAEFSLVALNHLSEALSLEIGLAEEELESAARAQKLRGWSLAVAAYLRELDALQQDIEREEDAQLGAVYARDLEIRVAARAAILTHPRAEQQGVMEQAILAEFCLGRDCETYGSTATSAPLKPIPISRGGVRPRWQFTGAGVQCESHGLSIHFADATRLSRHRLLCEQFLQEALSLADGIAWQQRHGVEPNWALLKASPLSGRPEHQVTLSKVGDSMLVSIPVIAGTDGLLPTLIPWLRSRVEAQPGYTLILDAHELGWQ